MGPVGMFGCGSVGHYLDAGPEYSWTDALGERGEVVLRSYEAYEWPGWSETLAGTARPLSLRARSAPASESAHVTRGAFLRVVCTLPVPRAFSALLVRAGTCLCDCKARCCCTKRARCFRAQGVWDRRLACLAAVGRRWAWTSPLPLVQGATHCTSATCARLGSQSDPP